MPRALEIARGGARRYRTIDVGKNKYIHIAVVRKAGKRGGHTIAGPVRTIKTGGKMGSRRKSRRSTLDQRASIFYTPGRY